jgi:antitoxin (DNA-binding transcriptional repressor) of toxin-antitoxin stability system
MPSQITIKELHATTGEHVRRIGASRSPVLITDHGEPVAVLGNLSLLKSRRRQRTLLPEFTALMRRPTATNVVEDLAAIRGEE